MSLNLSRRHLTTGQKGMVAAKALPLHQAGRAAGVGKTTVKAVVLALRHSGEAGINFVYVCEIIRFHTFGVRMHLQDIGKLSRDMLILSQLREVICKEHVNLRLFPDYAANGSERPAVGIVGLDAL